MPGSDAVRTPTLLRELRVDPVTHPRGQAHLSSASALVQAGPWLYLVADDEHHLGMFEAAGDPSKPVELHRIVPGDLPRGKHERKRHKPDLEALVLLPAGGTAARNALPEPQILLALGSGSRPNRELGFVLALDGESRPAGEARPIDLAALYAPLRAVFADLNIEGAFLVDGEFRLLQRGNKGDARNACIAYPLAEFRDWIAGGITMPPHALRTTLFALGELAGVPFGFTDAAVLPGGGWMFSAVAEDTGDAYLDGACAGSAIGWVDGDGNLQRMEPLAGAPKVEGVAVAADGRILMVTDADDPEAASCLLQLNLA